MLWGSGLAVFTISKSFVQNEELENQKLEQLALLKDLEEQKAKLEQMLLESQQEKNQLEMVVTHEEPQPESIISDRGGGSAETTQVCWVLIILSCSSCFSRGVVRYLSFRDCSSSPFFGVFASFLVWDE